METFIEGNGLQEKEEKSMKNCTICEREVDDYIQKCPHCGHDFNFVYDKDPVAFEERFEAPDIFPEAVGKHMMTRASEYLDDEDVKENLTSKFLYYDGAETKKALIREKNISLLTSMLLQTLQFDKIKARTSKEEEKIYHLEIKNRNFVLMYFSVLNAVTMLLVLLVRKELLFRVELYLSIVCFIVSVILSCVVKKVQNLVKIVQDVLLAIFFLQLSFVISYQSMSESSSAIWQYFGCIIIGVFIAVDYYKKVGKTYPICIPIFLIGAFEMLIGRYVLQGMDLMTSESKKATIMSDVIEHTGLVFALLAGGFFAVFILDIIHYIKTRKSSHVS